MTLLFALFAGCAHTVNLRVLEPADVHIPADVTRIAVIERTRPRNAGQGAVDVIEGILTGEAPRMDREGAQAAVGGVVERIRESPRFEAVVPLLDRSRFPSDFYDRPLTMQQVKQICRQTNTQAVISLDLFDTDSTVSLSSRTEWVTDPHGRQVAVLLHDAVRQTAARSSWRLYVPDHGGVLDELSDLQRMESWSAEGRTPALATAALINPWETARIVGLASGRAYGARVTPTWTWLGRTYYGGGDPRLKQARRHVRAGDWEGAREVWDGMRDDPNRRRRGKALLGIALSHEVAGELYPARKAAKEAAVTWSKSSTRLYVRQLDRRIADRQRLKEQMAPPPPKPPARQHPADAPMAIPQPGAAPAPRPPTPRPAPQPAPAPAPPPRLERPR